MSPEKITICVLAVIAAVLLLAVLVEIHRMKEQLDQLEGRKKIKRPGFWARVWTR